MKMKFLQSFLPQILDTGYSLFVCIDSSGHILFANKVMLELTGFEENDVTGKKWTELFVNDLERDLVDEQILNLLRLEADTEFKIEYLISTARGDKLLVEWVNKLVKDKTMETRYVLLFGKDVTERTVLLNQIAQLEVKRRNELITSVIDAQEKERLEIAMELHDNIGQLLTTCKLLLESELSNTDQYPSIRTTYNYLQNAITELRSISQQLNPSHIKDLGFEEALGELVSHFQLVGKIKIHFSIAGRDRLLNTPLNLQLSVYRIVQEQFNNIIKYAQASRVELLLDAGEHFLDVEVRDNGKGFDLKQVKRGNGIRNIYNRAELHGGTVYINAAPGRGCAVSICLPI